MRISLSLSSLIQLRYLTFLQLQGNLRNIWVLDDAHVHAHAHTHTYTWRHTGR